MQKPICHPDRKYCAKGKCHSCWVKDWRLANPEKHAEIKKRYNKSTARLNQNLKKFNITITEYNTLLELQNGVCAICKRPPKSGPYGRLAVDHNHKTGLIRGLLCTACNTALGRFKDCTKFLQEAIIYLNK